MFQPLDAKLLHRVDSAAPSLHPREDFLEAQSSHLPHHPAAPDHPNQCHIPAALHPSPASKKHLDFRPHTTGEVYDNVPSAICDYSRRARNEIRCVAKWGCKRKDEKICRFDCPGHKVPHLVDGQILNDKHLSIYSPL